MAICDGGGSHETFAKMVTKPRVVVAMATQLFFLLRRRTIAAPVPIYFLASRDVCCHSILGIYFGGSASDIPVMRGPWNARSQVHGTWFQCAASVQPSPVSREK